MRNLILFISRFGAFILFFLFEGLAISIYISNNAYSRSVSFGSSNQIAATLYQNANSISEYLSLKTTNDSLAHENALLRNQLQTVAKKSIPSGVMSATVRVEKTDYRYSYIAADVINNSVHQRNNYITINKGRDAGIRRGMGVICPNGVVGIVLNVTSNFSVIQSLLHKDTRISAMLERTQSFGSLVWGDNIDSRKATLKDVPSHVSVKVNDKVVTSGFSLFPVGIPIGKVTRSGVKGGGSFLDVEVVLSTNFNSLRYVYVVMDKMGGEQQILESKNKYD